MARTRKKMLGQDRRRGPSRADPMAHRSDHAFIQAKRSVSRELGFPMRLDDDGMGWLEIHGRSGRLDRAMTAFERPTSRTPLEHRFLFQLAIACFNDRLLAAKMEGRVLSDAERTPFEEFILRHQDSEAELINDWTDGSAAEFLSVLVPDVRKPESREPFVSWARRALANLTSDRGR